MAVRPAVRQSSIAIGYAAGFIVGGAVTIAGALSRWMTTGGLIDSAGIDLGEGRIILLLGIIATLLGVVAAFNRATLVELLIAAIGCALTATVLSITVREIREIDTFPDALAFVSATARASG